MNRTDDSRKKPELQKTADDVANGELPDVKRAIKRNREALENGAQVPGGSYDVDPAYASAAAAGADDSFGGDLDEQPDQPTKSP